MVSSGCREPSAELDVTAKLTKGMELLLCTSLPLPAAGISFVSVGFWRVHHPKDSTQPGSYYHGQKLGISPYLITFIKYLPYNVKTT